MDTIGELRARLAETDARWRVDPTLKDTDPIPQFRTGGIWTEDPPRPASLTPEQLREIVSRPSANPFVVQRRCVQGFLDPRSIDPILRAPSIAGGAAGGPPSTPLPNPPPGVDWRNRFGWPWVTSVQQQLCQDCWAFSAVALMEAMVRIEHCVWFKGAEGAIRWGWGSTCPTFGGANNSMTWSIDHGLCDEECEPYSASDTPDVPCADISGRTLRLQQANWVIVPHPTATNPDYRMQKTWLDLVGPLVVFFDASQLGPIGTGVYHLVPAGTQPHMQHFVLIVGYDDSKSAWICKNSAGPTWNGNGYFYLEYGAAGSELNGHCGVYGTNPDPWSKRRLHNGGMVESGNGAEHRNFEMLSTTRAPGGPVNQLRHYWRDGTSLQWYQAQLFADDVAEPPTLIESTYDRNFESIHVTQAGELHHWYFVQTDGMWVDGEVFGSNAVGRPGFIQSNYGCPGSFEVIVRTIDERLQHWSRTNSPTPGKWTLQATFGRGIAVAGPAFIQSHYGTRGNFEVVVVLSSGEMQHIWRDNDHADIWHVGNIFTGEFFGENITAAPCMIEASYGAANEKAVGNFELCVAVGGQFQHWYRDNQGNTGWHLTATVGDDVEEVIGVVQSSYGFDLEVIVLTTRDMLEHYYRDPFGTWHGGIAVGPG
jgi:hypothetical protein